MVLDERLWTFRDLSQRVSYSQLWHVKGQCTPTTRQSLAPGTPSLPGLLGDAKKTFIGDIGDDPLYIVGSFMDKHIKTSHD